MYIYICIYIYYIYKSIYINIYIYIYIYYSIENPSLQKVSPNIINCHDIISPTLYFIWLSY